MADASLIFANQPAQITIYDSTNNAMYLGYVNAKNFKITSKPLVHKNISKMEVQYGTEFTLKVQLLEADPGKIADLKARRSLKQDVFITGAEYGVKFNDCYIQHSQANDFSLKGINYLEITCKTGVESNVEVIKNLLSSVTNSYDYGNMDVDTNADGISNGWTEEGTLDTHQRNTPSFLGAGYGYDQQIIAEEPGADAGIYCDILWPIDQAVKVTASAYVKYGSIQTDNTFVFQVRTKDSALSTLDTNESSQKSATDTSVRNSYTVSFTPSAGAHYLSMYILIESGEDSDILIDNAQLEFGPLTSYSQND